MAADPLRDEAREQDRLLHERDKQAREELGRKHDDPAGLDQVVTGDWPPRPQRAQDA